ncbi:MAG TPA: NADH-quinone oxidoreductase subunit J [Acidobacteriota bacterium]|nr:NADH-quinone oxidoreductase subunit J [Acidobacteriota bacterium]
MEQLVFYSAALVAVVSALLVVFQRRAVHSVLALIVCLSSVAVLYFQLGGYFLAAVQVIVYAGAVMVLFLFVIMLIDPESEMFVVKRTRSLLLPALVVAGVTGGVLSSVLLSFPESRTPGMPGGLRDIAAALFRDYLLPFEITSILILAAVVGALILAKRSD